MATKRAGLARARRAAGYTHEALAYTLNVDPSTVNRWEVARLSHYRTSAPSWPSCCTSRATSWKSCWKKAGKRASSDRGRGATSLPVGPGH